MKLESTERVSAIPGCDPCRGTVRWAPSKSLWLGAMTAVGVVGAPLTASWDAAAVFVALTGVTVCAGHSVGMHRLLIHRSFEAPLALERLLVWLGTLVGMAGPFGMIRAHDTRDWLQRQRDCHDHAAHRREPLADYWWQTHCALELDRPPRLEIEPRVREDRFYRWLEATWMGQQLPVALVLFALGGWGWVVWGVCLRVSVSLTGHWLIGHLAHRGRSHAWHIDGLAVQGYDVAGAGLITFGEAWHGNHHAWPGSARLGLFPGQADPGWWLVSALERVGLARNVQTPERLAPRDGARLVVAGGPGGAPGAVGAAAVATRRQRSPVKRGARLSRNAATPSA